MERTFESFVKVVERSFDVPRELMALIREVKKRGYIFRDSGRDKDGRSICTISTEYGTVVFSTEKELIRVFVVTDDGRNDSGEFGITPNDWKSVPEEWK